MKNDFNMCQLCWGGGIAKLFLLGVCFSVASALYAATIPSGEISVGNHNEADMNSGGTYTISTPGDRGGSFKFNSGVLLQNTGMVRYTHNNWMTLGQNGSATWNLSGDAQAYLNYNNDATNRLNYAFCLATTSTQTSTPTLNILPDSTARLYTKEFSVASHGDYAKVTATVNQQSGTIYAQYFCVRGTENTNPTVCTINLSGGEMYIGQAGGIVAGTTTDSVAPTMNFTGGTLAFEKWNGSLTNKGGKVEIYGGLLNSLTPSTYTYAKFQAGAPAFTAYGTSTVTGTYTQSAGTLVLDYKSATEKDTLAANAVSITGGNIYVRMPWSGVPSQISYKPFSLPTGVNPSVSGTSITTMAGWKLKIAADGTITSNMTELSGTPSTTTIKAGDGYITRSNTYFGNQLTISGGSLYQASGNMYFNSSKVTQTGGYVVSRPDTGFLVFNENTALNQTFTYDLSGGGLYYASKSNSTVLVLSKCKLATFNISGSGVFHASYANSIAGDLTDAQGIINQTGGEAYIATFRMYGNTKSGAGTENQYNLSGGKLIIGTLDRLKADGKTVVGTQEGKINLTGGTFAVETSKIDLTNNGSTMEIYGNVSSSLLDFNYLGDTTVSGSIAPTGFTDLGTTTVTGKYTQNTGTLVLDYKSNTSGNYDVLKVTTADFNGGEIYVRTDFGTAINASNSFKGIQATTFTNDGTIVRGSMTGWNWKVASDGTVSSDMTKATTDQTTVNGKGYYTDAATTFTKDLAISDGSLMLQGGDTKFSSKVTQTGGVVVSMPSAGNFVLGSEYNLSDGALYFTSTDAKSLTVAASGTGTFNLSGDGFVHAYDVTLMDSTNKSARGIVNQTGGTAYLKTLHVLGNDATASGTNQYNLSDGELVVGNLTNRTLASASVGANAGKLNLTGGTFAVEVSDMAVTNDGATVEVYGNIINALSDFSYLNDGDDATDRPTFGATGTSRINGKYTQNGGQLVLDYVSSTSYDQLKASSATLNGGEIQIRTEDGALIGTGTNFQGISAGTLDTSKITIKASQTGLKWKIDKNGKITPDVTQNWGNLTSVTDGQSVITNGIVRFTAETINISGGTLYSMSASETAFGTYFQGKTVNQTGGMVITSTNQKYLVFNENGTKFTYNLSGGGVYYTGNVGGTAVLSKCDDGKVSISGDSVMHMTTAGITASDRAASRGVVTQTGGEAYFGNFRLFGTDSTAGTNQYNLQGGQLMIGTLTNLKGDGKSTVGSKPGELNLTGGTFAVENSKINIVNNGSTVEIYGNLSEALLDTSYLNDADDATDRPTGYTPIGIMTVEGSYTQESGRLVIDVAKKDVVQGLQLATINNESIDDLEFDVLSATEGIFLNGGSLFVNYDGDIDSIESGTTLDIWENSLVTFGKGFNLMAKGLNGASWLISAEGITYLGNIPEPATWVLLVLGLGLAWFIKKK